MNVDLRLEYKNGTNDHGALSEDERKNRYLTWLEDELTKERKQVKKLIIGGVSNRRELLAFEDWVNKNTTTALKDGIKLALENYKKANCG